MKPFHDYDLSKVIHNQREAVKNKIDSISNEVIMGNDIDVILENIYQEYYIAPVTIYEEDFSRRKIKQEKIRKFVQPIFKSYSGEEYVLVDGIVATFYFPYKGDKELFKCQASTFSLSGYPDISVDNDVIAIRIERTLNEMNEDNAKEQLLKSLERDLNSIKSGINYANNDVIRFNESLRKEAESLLITKKDKVESFFSIASMLEVPIEKKEYAQQHIPLQRKIIPLTQHYESTNYYGITDKDYNDIITTIKHTLSTYERTPKSYKKLGEEELRDTLLASLNATYKGDATGETFRNAGKTDICIERENRAAFVAECKIWTGSKQIGEAVYQLDSYLTWRDCKTALIFFVRRKDFLSVIESARKALQLTDGMKNVFEVDRNEFKCIFLSESNPGQKVEMRVMLFDLYCKE